MKGSHKLRPDRFINYYPERDDKSKVGWWERWAETQEKELREWKQALEVNSDFAETEEKSAFWDGRLSAVKELLGEA